MLVSFGCASTASPAELVLAQAASHVIATLVLLDLSSAVRADRHVVFVFICPTLEPFLHGFFAADIVMPIVTAREAHFGGACRAGELLCVRVRGLHVRIAACFRAPSDKWVRIDGFLVFEALKFLVQLRFASHYEDTLESLVRNLLSALVLATLDFLDFTRFDVALKVLDGAITTEAMFTFEFDSTEIPRFNLLAVRHDNVRVADRTVCLFFFFKISIGLGLRLLLDLFHDLISDFGHLSRHLSDHCGPRGFVCAFLARGRWVAVQQLVVRLRFLTYDSFLVLRMQRLHLLADVANLVANWSHFDVAKIRYIRLGELWCVWQGLNEFMPHSQPAGRVLFSLIDEASCLLNADEGCREESISCNDWCDSITLSQEVVHPHVICILGQVLFVVEIDAT